jgi:phytoene/squalene synthetase
MNNLREIKDLFKQSSPGLFAISKNLPGEKKYAFYRIFVFIKKAQLYLDFQPPQLNSFENYQTRIGQIRSQLEIYQNKILENLEDDSLIKEFILLEAAFEIPEIWIETFLQVLKEASTHKNFSLTSEMKLNLQNSSEILGKILAKTLELPVESWVFLGKLASSYYLLDWFRQIPLNQERKTTFFPLELLKKYNLKNLSEIEVTSKPQEFKTFSKVILNLSEDYFLQAEPGFIYILDVYKPTLKLFIEYRKWLASQIELDPFIIYTKFLEPDSKLLLTWKLKTIFHKTL